MMPNSALAVSDRRTFFGLLAGLPGLPRVASAQPVERVHRIGWIAATGRLQEAYNIAFVQRLRELGFVEGRNLLIDYRATEGRLDRVAGAAADLARAIPDVLVAPGSEANLAAIKQASRDTPIVMVAVDYDPVAKGHIASLARPGGRITGVYTLMIELTEKRLELLKELLPGVRLIAVLADSSTAGQLQAAHAAARKLRVALHVHEFKSQPYDYAGAFAAVARAKADAVLALGSAWFVPGRRLIPELALKHRLPSMFNNAAWTEARGLLSYGANLSEIYRRAADKVATLLKGASPAETPVEQANVAELVVNLQTAKALGLTIPPALLARADRMIDP
jgi:putative tryptophan/tyrosine transport system substrate-binding protein